MDDKENITYNYLKELWNQAVTLEEKEAIIIVKGMVLKDRMKNNGR